MKRKFSQQLIWQAPIPQTPKQKHVKRCYICWRVRPWGDGDRGRGYTGSKVVWLTDAQLTFARIKHPRIEFKLILERDLLEEYKKYMEQTID